MRVLAAAAVAFALGLSWSSLEAQPRPNVLLITLDTTRADRMGFLGSTRGLTPGMDALARDAVVFTRAYSQAPVTTVSHATILTGTYPPFHHVNDFGAPLPASVPYLPDLLRQSGYRTAAFVGSLILDPRAGTAPGFDRGFETYDAGKACAARSTYAEFNASGSVEMNAATIRTRIHAKGRADAKQPALETPNS